MPAFGPWVALIDLPIDQAIEEHRRGPRQHHAHDDESKDAKGRATVCGYQQRSERKGQGKDRVRETNEAEKPGYRSVVLGPGSCFHGDASGTARQELFEA